MLKTSEAVSIYYASLFMIYLFAGDLKFCKVTIHLKFCKVEPFRVQV